MTVRCELNINGVTRRLLLSAKEEEPVDHVALRLAAVILFFDSNPVLESGPNHPAIADIGFFPDLMCLNDVGELAVWVECGNTAVNKLTKVARRLRGARMVILRESLEEGERLRAVIKKEINKGEKIEIWAWPKEDFKKWVFALKESTFAFGEASGNSLNLVLNDIAFSVQLKMF